MSRGDQPGTFELLARLPGQIVGLAKAEYENAKREIAAKAKRAGIGALAITVALFFLFWAISAFIFAAIAGLAVVWPWWLSALVVGFGLLLLAAAAIFAGIALIKRGIPVPEDTIDRIEDDLNAFGEVGFNASAHAPRGSQRRAPRAPGRADDKEDLR
ncbi:MAG: phage holin family protein [Actinobacteria bacterium]|nr:phage holin family protein [Actinomycetota bacterium]